MRLALAQINPIVGDLDGNRALILELIVPGGFERYFLCSETFYEVTSGN